MERDRREVTGSRTGFVGNVVVYDPSTTGGRSGEEYFDRHQWNFRHVIQREKQLFEALARGRVTIGELEFVDEDGAEGDDGPPPPDPR